MGLNTYSDYGSGSSSESYTPWGSQDMWPEFKSVLQESNNAGRPRSSSFTQETRSRSLDAIMKEFRMNGFDSPYDPEQEFETKKYRAGLSGLGPAVSFLRQRSWPSAGPPSLTPRLRDEHSHSEPEAVGARQLRVLCSLPDSVLYSLLRELERTNVQPEKSKRRDREDMECRFCKNNGERPSYYRSHRLRARGRVSCPVLRAYTCRRCGAAGDHAHTLKYCPLTSADERMKSAAMMRSVRMASIKRRNFIQPPSSDLPDDYVTFGEATPSVITDGATYNNYETPLDPIWEALERKLMI